ncbi:glycosyltransferase [Bombilactobacillus thymidiniphilus]|uniref:Glycosyltransferase n=1 Tax=Bombilactobacillus thymidiniphilus TaxID=2923363 RepID=A0ABY4PBZ1_9LACO|nr:glycosyltransferase [Bombilactobacillus thymidiniphilus]UQS83207.1 glycosyltransferase [Bombilactobacillus thymidiniphilus]
MNFFINTDLSNASSGIEHSQIKRLHLFQQFQEPAKIITTFYRNNWAQGPGKFNVALDDVINVFDYFGNNRTDYFQVNTPQTYCKQHGFHIQRFLGVDKNEEGYLAITDDHRQLLIRSDTHSHQVTSVVFSNLNSSVPTSAEGYDTRGFLSAHYEYNRRGQAAKLRIINQQGQAFCTEIFKDGQKVMLYKLLFRGQKHNFNNLYSFQAFFFDNLNQDFGENNLFISDRVECTQGLSQMQTPAKKAVYIHSVFSKDVIKNDPMTDELNFNYEYALRHAEQFDYLICPTQWEKDELNQRFSLGDKVRVIPSGTTTPSLKRIPMKKRDPYLVLLVARISPEKQIDQALKIIARVKKHIPQVKLEIYGGITYMQEATKINNLVNELHLKDTVSFKGIVPNLDDVYDQASALMLTSSNEGLSLALLEGLSHGLPEISYDCRYGPSDIMVDNQNGYLIAQGDIYSATKKLTTILSDSKLRQDLSDKSYELVHNFSPKTIWQKWQTII